MKEILGEVDYKERGQIFAPGIIRPDKRSIPVLRLRILIQSGNLVQVLYKGDPPGDANEGEEVIIRGVDKGGVIYAKSIFNKTTNSWVTRKPGPFDCFIATAVYESPLAQEVIVFKTFRDECLMRNWFGRILIHFYCIASPLISAQIEKNDFLKIFIKNLILKPFLGLIRFIQRNKD